MESSSSLQFFVALSLAMGVAYLLLVMVVILLFSWWVMPCLAHRKLKANGFSGPKPSFPLGNLNDMKKLKMTTNISSSSSSSSLIISNDIHSTHFRTLLAGKNCTVRNVGPDFRSILYRKVFVYWLGTEPFLYIAEPEFLKKMSAEIRGKSWGKPNVFKHDREPMFGQGLLMVEGEDWVRHRHVITPAFSPANLKAMGSLMVDSAKNMLDRWTGLINSGQPEIDAEREIIKDRRRNNRQDKLRSKLLKRKKSARKIKRDANHALQNQPPRRVPFGKFLNPKQNLKAKTLGKEVDELLRSIITERREKPRTGNKPEQDLLGLLLADNTVDGRKKRALTTKELVDECKTFFFGGHETTALALTWTLLLLGLHPEWQEELREEIKHVVGDGEIVDATMLVGLKKMEWVMNEVLRLYPPAPNVQRQARQDIQVDNLVIPNGTNMWIDVVSMHHDENLWGKDVNEFKPERFKDNIHGGCNHKMGFLPFGFGGRMCVGKNLTNMEYKIVLTLILSRFSFSIP
ncbi:hypothetical protein DH2020_009936 [Rehmannia glutinosa]|uniref:Uncharacterized protein n=1 Tax=Rehmannia glutinosa TaxID=99300 RepID=A0ABR0X8R2_REHGL